jgi:hypothetical protein
MRWADNSILVYVPGGEFEMGGDSLDNPRHAVTLSAFWIQRSEVTNRQYRLCVDLGICLPLENEEALHAFRDDALADHPVAGVTWGQAQTYCNWIRGSLPGEAQWEFSARGLEASSYPWGDEPPTCDLANFKGCGDGSKTVGELTGGASPFGLFDMSGNVFEWVNDRYDGTYYLNSPAVDPPGPDLGTTRVVRSSSYLSNESDLPASKRSQLEPDKHRADLGFRCVVKELSYLASSCQAAPVYAPGFNTGGSSGGGNCAAPQITRTTHGCSSGQGFGRADLAGPFAVDLPDGCAQEGNSIVCLGSGQNFSVDVCGACAADNEDSACAVGYESSGDACEYAPGSCIEGYSPHADGVCMPNECADLLNEGCLGFSCLAALGCMAEHIDNPICQSGYELIETSEVRGCFPSGAIPEGACPEGTYYDAGVGGCARPAGSSGNACPAGQSPYMDGLCAPDECVSSLGGGCFGMECWQQSMCAALIGNNPTCQAGYAFVAGTGCVPVGSTGEAGLDTEDLAGEALGPCLAGFNYDAELMCCQTDAAAGCPAGQLSNGETCIAPTLGRSASPDSCTTINLQAQTCGAGPGGLDGGAGSCPRPAWCTNWDSSFCICLDVE